MKTNMIWFTPREIALILNTSTSVLAKWRREDVRMGRGWPEPGYLGLRWKHFGKSVRYLLPDGVLIEHGNNG